MLGFAEDPAAEILKLVKEAMPRLSRRGGAKEIVCLRTGVKFFGEPSLFGKG